MPFMQLLRHDLAARQGMLRQSLKSLRDCLKRSCAPSNRQMLIVKCNDIFAEHKMVAFRNHDKWMSKHTCTDAAGNRPQVTSGQVSVWKPTLDLL